MLHARIPVLGVNVDFEANDASILTAVRTWAGASRESPPRDRTPAGTPDHDPVRVPRVRLLLENGLPPASAPPAFHAPRANLLIIRGAGFLGYADAAKLTASCCFDAELLEAREPFEDSVVATLSLFLVTRLDRQPFHAAALARGGRGVLLSSPSGGGKSTIALAARHEGWSVLSDDAVYLQAEPRLRLWTRPSNLHLQPDAARWFPELAALEPVMRANGKRKLVVENVVANGLRPLDHASICLLEPAPGRPELHRIDPVHAVDSILRKLDPGFDAFRHTIGPALQAVAVWGTWVLRTGDDPRLAARLLARLPEPPSP